jgi:phasin family protein
MSTPATPKVPRSGGEANAHRHQIAANLSDPGVTQMAKTHTVETETFKAPDFTQFQSELNRWAGDFAKFFSNSKVPAFDFDAVFAAQRKNVEAFSAANQAAFESYKTIAKRQAEIARQAFEDFTKVSKEMTGAGTPEEKIAKHADVAKAAFEQAIENLRETLDTLQKGQAEALEVISKRVVANFDETKALIAKAPFLKK